MDRVAEIIRLERMSEAPEGEASKNRWEAARLIWEELQVPGRSKNGLAKEIGKSATHVRWAFRCWEMTGKEIAESGIGVYPDFQAIYRSPEVRCDPDEPKARKPMTEDSQEPVQRKQRARKEPADSGPGHNYTAHGMVMAAHEAITTLAKNPATYSPFFKEDDQEKLASLVPLIESITRETSATVTNALLSA